MTYTVVRRPDGKVVAEGISATECSDIIADMPMASYYYEVTANAGDAASAVAATDPIVLGSYVSLPIDHQFKQSDNEFGLYTVIDANGDNKVTLSWDNPATRWNRRPLSNLSEVWIYRDSYSGEPVAKLPATGKKVSP